MGQTFTKRCLPGEILRRKVHSLERKINTVNPRLNSKEVEAILNCIVLCSPRQYRTGQDRKVHYSTK